MKKHCSYTPFIGSLLYLLPLLTVVNVNAYAKQDSDGDGLTDKVEIAQGLDPYSADSNMNGLSDFDEYNSKHDFVKSKSTRAIDGSDANTADTDKDGLDDFLETYGFYVVDNLPLSAPRRIPLYAWDALKTNPLAVQGSLVFSTALSRLEQDLRAKPDPTDANFIILTLDGAKDAIIAAYLEAGISSTSQVIEGASNVEGSAANIVSTLMKQKIQQPRGADGNPLPLYFTHPLKVSTDHDPYTDYHEAIGLFPGGRPLAPADHPLIAAAPSIKASLEDFEVVLIEENALTLGEENAELTGQVTSETRSHSHGVSIAVGAEVSFGLDPSVTLSTEVTQSNSWDFSSATSLEQSNSHATYSEGGTTTQSNCFAKLAMNLGVKNVGYANATNISLAFNIYLGDTQTPWETIAVGTDGIGNLLLAPGQTQTIAVLRTEDEACLTIDETNYLAQGGQISIETIVADASVDFYNSSKNIIEQGGSWQVYNSLIQRDLALLTIDVNAVSGKPVNHSIYYTVADNSYPNLGLSVQQALATAFTAQPCTAGLNPNSRCYITKDGEHIVLGPKTYLDAVFYDDQGVSLSNLDMQAKYAQLAPLGDADPFNKVLPRRSSMAIVNNDYEAPQFTHIEALNLVSPGAASKPDMLLRATVTDFFGIQDVVFCHSENRCVPMLKVFGNPDVAEHSGMYTINLPNYQFTGLEFVKAMNVIGNQSPNQTPLALFLLMNDSLAALIADYADHVDRVQNRINALSKLQTDSPADYNAIIDQGLLTPTGGAQSLLNGLKNYLKDAKSACTLNVADLTQNIGENIESIRQSCLSHYRDLAQAVSDTPLKAYDINKLPGKYVQERYLGRTKAGKDRGKADFDAGLSRDCILGKNQFSVGIGMYKANNKSTPVGIHLHYVEYDPVAKTLSDKKVKKCGTGGPERQNILNHNPSELTAELILDTAMRLDDNMRPINFKKSRFIENLCVTYRTFNFKLAQWQGDFKIKCNNNTKTKFDSSEGGTGLNGKNNRTLALKGLSVFHREGNHDSDIMEVFGYHSQLYGDFYSVPFNALNEFTEYKISNIETGKLLTVTSQSGSSAAIGMDNSNGSDNQVWKVERVNDRELRLVPKVFPGGVFVNNLDSPPSVAMLGNELKPNYLQHLMVSEVNFASSSHVIRSVVGAGFLNVATNNTLNWKLRESFASGLNNSQKWTFTPVKNEPVTSAKEEQVLSLTKSTQSTDLFGSCQVFDLGGEYFISKLVLNGKQNTLNKSARLVSLNNTEAFSRMVYPPTGSFKYTRLLPQVSTKSTSIKVCNTFFATPKNTSWVGGNKVNSIMVTATSAN